jgi:hypothetical protein
MKGLPRSLARAMPQLASVQKLNIVIDTTLSFTGVTDTVVRAQAVLAGLPQGNILFLGAVSYLKLTGPGSANLADDFEGDYGIGTAPNADADLSDPTDDNIIPSTAISAATNEVTEVIRGTSTESAEQGAIFDNTDGSLELNLNVLLDANEVTNAETVDVRATGMLYIAYVVLGDD